jgi:heme o synthase
VPLEIFVFGLLGIGLAAASGAAINHVVDEHIDRIMERTRNRPLVSGELDQKSALIFALSIGAAGIAMLALFVNLLTAVLTFFSLVGYALIYTMYLKRATPQNIVLGGAAGAAPPLLGWTAVTGTVDTEALLLFLIIFIWTPPHFWALAIHRRDDYAKVNLPMLPVTHGIEFTKYSILGYTILMILVTIFPYLIGMRGLIYLVAALLLGGYFLYMVLLLMFTERHNIAIKTFVYSINYLMLLFIAMVVDHYLPIYPGY